MKRSLVFASLASAGIVVLAAPASASPFESHCWCKLTKADLGDCSARGIVVDAGAIATFNNFMPGKNEKCRAACDRVLAERPLADLCGGLQRLGVPLPWNGRIKTCARVGASGDRASAARDIACAAAPAPASLPGGYWKLTFADEFKGMPANAPAAVQQCYTRAPYCLEMYKSGAAPCPPNALGFANVRHLDKCTWTLLHRQNTWGPELGAFDTRQVEVRPNEDDGVLVLTTRAVDPAGSYLTFDAKKTREGKWESREPYKKESKWRFAGRYDCTRTEWNQQSRIACPFVSGALISQSAGSNLGAEPVGFKQRFGRFEFRAKLSYGPSPGPSAMWMLPQSGPWPGAGEIDVMEQDKDGESPFQTFHTGTCSKDGRAALDAAACKASGSKQFHIMKGESTRTRDLAADRTPFWKGFHTYAVEWDPQSIRFLVDDQIRNTIRAGEIKQGSEMDVAAGKKAERKWMPMWIPEREFYFLLTQGPAHLHRKLLGLIPSERKLNPDNFVPFEMRIDWIRAYKRCEAPADFCPSGGAFDAASGRCRGAGAEYASACVPRPAR